jgi:uncharacterized protein YndB with AHSA1/START domain
MATTTRSAHLDAAPDDVFAVLTDPTGLPTWNRAIRRVVHAPAPLVEGDEWVVELHVMGRTWHSRSRVLSIDGAARTFAHRSGTDDGNPSWAEWCWSVTAEPSGGSLVTVTFDLHPKTFWRRLLFVHVRRYQLAAQELPRSLAALSAASKASLAGG